LDIKILLVKQKPRVDPLFLRFTALPKEKLTGRKLLQQQIGMANKDTGEIEVSYDYKNLLAEIELKYMTAYSLTGLPEPDSPLDPAAINPFLGAESINFTRTIKFLGSNEKMVVVASYDRTPDGGFTGQFDVNGDFPIKKVVSVEPTVETWVPGESPGKVKGSFVMCWKTDRDEQVCAETSTDYTIVGGINAQKFTSQNFRYITIQMSSTGNKYFQQEQISLFKKLSGHDPHLKTIPKIINE